MPASTCQCRQVVCRHDKNTLTRKLYKLNRGRLFQPASARQRLSECVQAAFLTSGMMGKVLANLKCHLSRHLQRGPCGQFQLCTLTVHTLRIYILDLTPQTIERLRGVFCAQFF